MKTKLLALTLALLMIVAAFPAGAIGMIGVENTDEISEIIPETTETAVLSVSEEIPEYAPEWAVLYEDYNSYDQDDNTKISGSKKFAYADPDFAEANLTQYNTSGTYSAAPDDVNNTVYKIQSHGMYNAGLRVDFPVNLSKPGDYTLSYRWYVEPEAGAKFDWVSTFSRIYFAQSEVDGNFFSSKNDAVTKYGYWTTQVVNFKISESDGQMYIAVDGGSQKELKDDICKIIIHTESHNAYSKTDGSKGFDDSTTEDGYFTWYFDDIYLAYYPQTTTVKYVDLKGNTLLTETATDRNITLASKSALGISYYPAFSYEGTELPYGKFVIPTDAEEVTINVSQNNIIIAEDFETYSHGYAFLNPAANEQKEMATSFVREGVAARIQSGDCNTADDGTKTAAEWYIDTLEDGNQVLHVYGHRARWNSVGIKFNKLDLSVPGTYILSFDAQKLRGNANVWSQVTGIIPGIATDIAVGEPMKTVVIKFVVTENDDGTLNCIASSNASGATPSVSNVTKAAASSSNYCWYPNAESTTGGVSEVLIDNIVFSYAEPVTVKYVDENTNVLNTVETITGTWLKLPSGSDIGYDYSVTYTVGKRVYKENDTIALPANSVDGVIEILVDALEFPENAPDNAILFVDFEDEFKLGTVSDTKKLFTYRKSGQNSAKFSQYNAWGSFELAPDDDTNTVFKVVGQSRYSNGITLSGLNISEVGKYTIEYDFYTPDSADKHPNLSGFARIYDADGTTSRQWGGWSNGDINRGAWNTVKYTWEIFMENGKKMIKWNSWENAVEFTKATKIEAYNECNVPSGASASTATADNPYTVYYDNVRITHTPVTTVTAYFEDINGEEFDYSTVQSSLGGAVVLPTAAEMGLGYQPKFTAPDGRVYYAGMKYVPEKASETVTFVVENTNVILFDNLEFTEKGWADPAFAIDSMSDAKIYGDRTFDFNGNRAMRSKNVSGGSETPELFKLSITKPGIYKLSVDATLDLVKSSEDDYVDKDLYVNLQLVGVSAVIWTSTGDNFRLTENDPSKKITGWFEVYEEEGTLYIRRFNHTHSSKMEASKIDQIRFGVIPSEALKNASQPKAEHYVYYDNATIEYFPYEAQNTGLASYRPFDADGMGGPAGVRFASYIADDQKALATEYGYVVTRKDSITVDGVTNYELLNLKGVDSVSVTGTTSKVNSDGIKIVAAASYDGVTDKVYSTDGKYFANEEVTFLGSAYTFFTGVLYGMDDDKKKADVFVARPYVKIDGVYYYGECHEASYNEVYNKANA